MDKWISVGDGLPTGRCIALDNRNDMFIGSLQWDEEQEWYECEEDGIYLTNVTHWMPLPQPPRNFGYWIEHNDDWGLTYECSVCHVEGMMNTDYCYLCGAKMEI